MFPILFISILFARIQPLPCNYLEAESNYHKPKLERNNIVNKGVWVRNKFKDNLFEKASLGDVIFRPSSLDADRLLQTNFDAFAGNAMAETPFLSSFVDRVRRSPDLVHQKRHTRKSMRKVKRLKTPVEDTKSVNTNIMLKLKPSLFDGYLYESILPNKNNEPNHVDDRKDKQNATTSTTNTKHTNDVNVKENTTKTFIEAGNITEATTVEIDVKSPPQRTKKHNYGIDDNETLDILFENFNKTNKISKTNRDVFDKDDRIWHQNAPIPDTNIYEVVPKEQEKVKGVSERGLIKVISMLTKTFKKTMKQHTEVKLIYDKFTMINENFLKQINDMNTKFRNFDSKYSDMIQFNEKLKTFENKLANEEEYLKKQHKDMEFNNAEFENQQNKFLNQQKQFYNVQKAMLAQNEKINNKQSAIAKTQSEISHRQNNFARILKKAKQMFKDNKKAKHNNLNNYKINDTHPKTILTTTDSTSGTESVKFNLFSIPAKAKLSNQDDSILKEKDDRPVDDIVYKYYFNNTFIDTLMKSKILNDYASNTNSIEIARNVKSKRNKQETTILLPMNKENKNKNRVRRWINHLNNINHKMTKKDTNTLKMNKEYAPNTKNDPFITMAKSFCNEIGQNVMQVLNWCVEKALRRLKFMDKKLFSQPVTLMKAKKQTLKNDNQFSTMKPGVTLFPVAPTTVWITNTAEPVRTTLYAIPNKDIFFPDNDELESNLKQYDLTPDTEGTVFYDGSLHFSDIRHNIGHDSDGMSDVMPGLVDSNSKVEMNPMAFDIQAKRRAYVNRLNEDIMKKIRSRKL